MHRRRVLAGAAGSALLMCAAVAQAQTFISGPGVSSIGPGSFTVFARQDDGRLYAVDQQQIYVPGGWGWPPIAFWQRTGWDVVPGGEDVNSDPDSTVDLWQQWVVARKSDYGCWYTTRPVSSAGPGAWTGIWNPCDSNSPRAFYSGISAVAVNYPDYGISAIHLFGRGTDNGIYHNIIYQGAGWSFPSGWTLVPGPVTDTTHFVSPTLDFAGDPDAAVAMTSDGPQVTVCAQRAFWDVVKSAARYYCSTYSHSNDSWIGYWTRQGVAAGENNTGTGATSSLDGRSYNLFFCLATSPLRWQRGPFGIAGLPNLHVSADPDAATFTDLFRSNAPSQVVCTRDTANQIQCSLWDGAAFGGWFAP